MSDPGPTIPDPVPVGPPQSAANRDLDTILVAGVLVIVAGVMWGLFNVTDIKATLPIIASMASALISAVISGYAGYRWGSSAALKKTSHPDAAQ